MNEIKVVTNESGVPTMSSIDMVAYINATREAGSPEVRHDNFMTKVPKVLGEKAAPKFLGTALYHVNSATRERLVYNFPEREANLMAMSYSYELTAAVYDAWVVAKEQLKANIVQLPNFNDNIEMAQYYITAETLKRENLLKIATVSNELEAALPAVAFRDAVVADDTMYSFAEAAKILGIGPRKLMKALREGGYLRKDNTPYERFIEYLKPSFRPQYVLPNGELAAATTHMTSKGLVYFQKKLTKK